MILRGEFVLPATRQRVWEALWDVQTVASWVPGCVAAERVDERTYRIRLEQQISMLKASFDLLLTVVESDPPSRILLRGTGEDRRISSTLQLESELRLEPAVDQATRVVYRHDLSVFGRLGAIGFPLIQRKAREAESEFARRAGAALRVEA